MGFGLDRDVRIHPGYGLTVGQGLLSLPLRQTGNQFGEWSKIMLGRSYTYNPNADAADKWVGQTVSFNGSDRAAEVLTAYWQGPGQAVQLRVSENGGEPFLTDSEHVVIVRHV